MTSLDALVATVDFARIGRSAARGNLTTLTDVARWRRVVSGPEMARLLPLIGRDRAHARLKGQTGWYKEAAMSFVFSPRCFEA